MSETELCHRCHALPIDNERFCYRCGLAVSIDELMHELKQTAPWRALVWTVDQLDDLADSVARWNIRQ